MSESATQPAPMGSVFDKQTLINGKPAQIRCIEIGGQTFAISRGPLTVVSLEDEWYADLTDPLAVISELNANGDFQPDLLTFWQRMPDIHPRYSFHLEWEDIA